MCVMVHTGDVSVWHILICVGMVVFMSIWACVSEAWAQSGRGGAIIGQAPLTLYFALPLALLERLHYWLLEWRARLTQRGIHASHFVSPSAWRAGE